MSRYLEFTTKLTSSDARFAKGSPIHDGQKPTKFLSLKGLRFDGEIVTFQDEILPHKLHKALLDGEKHKKRYRYFDCVILAALMYDAPIARSATGSYLTLRETTLPVDVFDDDTSVSVPVNLGTIVSGKARTFAYQHTIVPAHDLHQARYVHKLGETGPICLSGLTAAKAMYDCTIAHPMVNFSLET